MGKKVIETEILECDVCGSSIESGHAIKFPVGDLDVQGIWFGDVQEWLWFHEELFCSIGCMFKFIDKWHKEQEHSHA